MKAVKKPKAASPKRGAGKDPSTRAVVKALEALELLRGQAEWLPLQSIAAAIGLVKSSAYRILRSLESGGLVESAGGSYRIASQVGPLLPMPFLKTLGDAARDTMRELSMNYRESVALAFLFENHMEVVAMIDSPELISVGNVVGRILPPNSSSLGKSIMAFQTLDKREKLLRCYGLHRFTPNTIVDPVALSADYAAIQKRGYAIDNEENAIGGCCFGAPIREAGGMAYAALSVSFLKPRVPEGAALQQFLTRLKEGAKQIHEAVAKSQP